jgi:hypothetical protein
MAQASSPVTGTASTQVATQAADRIMDGIPLRPECWDNYPAANAEGNDAE